MVRLLRQNSACVEAPKKGYYGSSDYLKNQLYIFRKLVNCFFCQFAITNRVFSGHGGVRFQGIWVLLCVKVFPYCVHSNRGSYFGPVPNDNEGGGLNLH